MCDCLPYASHLPVCSYSTFADRHRPIVFIIIVYRDVQKTRIQVWLYENTDLRVEGRIIGFDEYMNLVLDDAEELSVKKMTRKALGRILLKGDNITLLMST